MTRMIAFDITKLTTEKFRQCTVHIKKMYYCCCFVFWWASIDRYRKHWIYTQRH